MPPKPPGRGAAQYSSPLAPLPFFMSAPAQKARSPAPVSTTHADVAIALDLAPDALQLGSVARSTALSTSGRSMRDAGDVVLDARTGSASLGRGRPRRRSSASTSSVCCAELRRRDGAIVTGASDMWIGRADAACTVSTTPGASMIMLVDASSARRPAPRAGCAPARRAGPAPPAAPASARVVLVAKRSRNSACSSGLCSICASKVGEARIVRQVARCRAPCRCRCSGFGLERADHHQRAVGASRTRRTAASRPSSAPSPRIMMRRGFLHLHRRASSCRATR